MNILITGGAGYIGSVLTGVLLNKGHNVTVLDKLIFNQTSLLHYCHHERFDFIKGDAREESLVKGLLKDKDVIIPLAAIVGAPASLSDPRMATSVNFEAIEMLNSIRSKDQGIVFPTTNSGYGTTSGEVYCTEETPLEPISLYGRTKVKAEKLLLESENAVTFRLATVFGISPRMRIDLLVNSFVYEALMRGYLIIYEKDFKRNYLHIRDVADGFCFAIDHYNEMKGEAYNLGLDEANLSKQELAETVKQYVPKLLIQYSEIDEDPDKRNYIVSNDKLKKKGFEAKRSIETGIQELIKGYKMMPLGPFKNA